MPTGNEMFKLLSHLDLAYKVEIVLYQIHSVVFWTTFLELSMFLALFILFCAAPKSMGVFWLLVLHVPRGVLGALLLKQMPKSHEIIEDLRFDDIPQAAMTVDAVSEKLKFSLSVQFMLAAENNKKWLTFYSVLTVACYIFDGFAFLIVLRSFANVEGREHSEMILLCACLFYFGVDMFYFLWVMVLRTRLPGQLGQLISDAVFGFTKKLTRELYSGLDQNQKALVEEEKHAINLDRQVQERKAKEVAERAKVAK